MARGTFLFLSSFSRDSEAIESRPDPPPGRTCPVSCDSQLNRYEHSQTGMDFNAKRMKGVFKKYLQFEMEHGDEAGVDAVKAKATEYVASLAG